MMRRAGLSDKQQAAQSCRTLRDALRSPLEGVWGELSLDLLGALARLAIHSGTIGLLPKHDALVH